MRIPPSDRTMLFSKYTALIAGDRFYYESVTVSDGRCLILRSVFLESQVMVLLSKNGCFLLVCFLAKYCKDSVGVAVERSGRKLRLIFLLDGEEEVQDIADIPVHLENETLTLRHFGDALKIKNVIELNIDGNSWEQTIFP